MKLFHHFETILRSPAITRVGAACAIVVTSTSSALALQGNAAPAKSYGAMYGLVGLLVALALIVVLKPATRGDEPPRQDSGIKK